MEEKEENKKQIVEYINTGKKYEKTIGEDQLLVNIPIYLKNYLKFYTLKHDLTLKRLIIKIIYDFIEKENKDYNKI